MRALGNGGKVTAQDTVAFTVWCAAHHLKDFEKALWYTVSGLGDRDTTCAIVGGIVTCHVGREGLPEKWLERRESLPGWPFSEDSAKWSFFKKNSKRPGL